MIEKIKLAKSAHALNDAVAQQNRQIFKDADVTVFNMISSPGSGKTSLLENLGRRLGQSLLVITGDIQTQLDKERIEKAGARAVQIETRGSCHLTANMINAVVKRLSFSGVDYLI
jgi:hydrogenase nickel incorporation protein HypB